MRYFLSAGEASGDLHAAALMQQLARLDTSAEFHFLGGDGMASAASCEPLIHIRDMAFMGFSEVLRNLSKIRRNMSVARASLGALCPDAVILVDYPGFNLKLARYAHSLGLPVFYYIAPKVWAWKEWRVKSLRRYCTEILSILPFETEFFARHGLDVTYVGNPSVEEIDARLCAMPPKPAMFESFGLDPERPMLALVPGSRVGEIRNNLPVMDAVARSHPNVQPVICGTPGISPDLYSSLSSLRVITGATMQLMALARAALVTSGTATLECALAGTPQVACYRANGSRFSHALFSHILKVPYVTLPNLIAGGPVIPEMLLHHCNPSEVGSRLTPLLDPESEVRRAQLQGYAAMRTRLGHTRAAATAAARILHHLNP